MVTEMTFSNYCQTEISHPLRIFFVTFFLNKWERNFNQRHQSAFDEPSFTIAIVKQSKKKINQNEIQFVTRRSLCIDCKLIHNLDAFWTQDFLVVQKTQSFSNKLLHFRRYPSLSLSQLQTQHQNRNQKRTQNQRHKAPLVDAPVVEAPVVQVVEAHVARWAVADRAAVVAWAWCQWPWFAAQVVDLAVDLVDQVHAAPAQAQAQAHVARVKVKRARVHVSRNILEILNYHLNGSLIWFNFYIYSLQL